MVALRQFRAIVLDGWLIGVAGGEATKTQLTFMEAGYMTYAVYAFCRESGNGFIPLGEELCLNNICAGELDFLPDRYNSMLCRCFDISTSSARTVHP